MIWNERISDIIDLDIIEQVNKWKQKVPENVVWFREVVKKDVANLNNWDWWDWDTDKLFDK